jgi:SAM-dependent methyltransferase
MTLPPLPADPFHHAAESYDATFSSLPRVIALRDQIHREFGRFARPPSRVLELGCGTGEDALRLAGRGFRVLATDPSPSMLAVAQKKSAGLGTALEFSALRSEETSSLGPGTFDAVFSNFGALNCVESLEPTFHAVAFVLRPGGMFLSVFLNRTHLWETAAHVARGNYRSAFRRWTSSPVDVPLSGTVCRTWYHSVSSISSAARRQFHIVEICGLNVFSPPPSSEKFDMRHRNLVRALDRLDAATASLWPFNRWGDHIMIVFRKRP